MCRTFFISEAIETISPDSDTLRLFEASVASARETLWVTPQQTLSIDGDLYLDQHLVGNEDVVWIRLAPTPAWHDFLVFLAAHPVSYINAPAAMLLYPDKMRCGDLSVPGRFVVSNVADALRAFDMARQRGHRGLAIKALIGYDSHAVTPAFDRKTVEEAFFQHAVVSGLAICEPWLPCADTRQEESTLRLTFANGRFIGAVEYFGPAASLSSPRLGAACRPAPTLPGHLFAKIEAHAKTMAKEGIFLIGYDVVENRVIEANTSCPGALSDTATHLQLPDVHALCIAEGLRWAHARKLFLAAGKATAAAR